MAIEIVDFPSYKMVIFHSYVNVYQGVPEINKQGSGKIMEHVWTCPLKGDL